VKQKNGKAGKGNLVCCYHYSYFGFPTMKHKKRTIFGVYRHIYIYIYIYTHQKYLESFEMWCWRRMEKISWTDHVKNEEVLLRVNEQKHILHEIRKQKANWMGHILRTNCLLKQVIEGKIEGEMEVARRRERSYWMTLRTGEDTLI